jgi:hypothetical protein
LRHPKFFSDKASHMIISGEVYPSRGSLSY